MSPRSSVLSTRSISQTSPQPQQKPYFHTMVEHTSIPSEPVFVQSTDPNDRSKIIFITQQVSITSTLSNEGINRVTVYETF